MLRSLEAKFTFSLAVTLLLCLLLFSVAAWGLPKYLSEHQANSDASTHLQLIKQAYQTQNTALIDGLTHAASESDLASRISQHYTLFSHTRLLDKLAPMLARYRLSELAVVSTSRYLLADVGDGKGIAVVGDVVAPGTLSLVDRALQGKVTSALRISQTSAAGAVPAWTLSLAIPIQDQADTTVGVLMAAQAIDDYFAHDLMQASGLNVVLCQSTTVLGMTVLNLDPSRTLPEATLCTPDVSHLINGPQHYLTLGSPVTSKNQLARSPSLTVVDVEPLYSSIYTRKFFLLLISLSIFVLALGVIASTFLARTFFILPVRRLQAHVTALVANRAVPTTDEFGRLASSFSLLSDSLHRQEHESRALTQQMGELLTMSDTLISTVDLEHLLGDIVSRLGTMMPIKNVSLLLYGREMLSPWAVACWTEQLPGTLLPLTGSSQRRGAVTVHTDPDGDVTLVMTSKLVAVPGRHSGAASGKGNQSAAKVPTNGRPQGSLFLQATVPIVTPYGLRLPHIPPSALRDFDMTLARLAMQKQKIVCGEDLAVISQKQRGETWARMALEAGYRSVIAVPLLLQEQAIGAFMLYRDTPYQMSSNDTFPLSTAANQAAMAIQNAILFAEVNEKNAALERVNHLKSQFLATVTHELRTPLHSIISYGALILEGFVDGVLTGEQEEHIQFMVRRAEDLSHLVDDMLDLSKIEADRLEVQIEPLSLAPCLTEVVNQLKPLANSRGLYLTLELEDSLPMVLADGGHLRQIVTNMVSNALKFTEQGGITIQCKLLSHNGMLRLSVSDTGIGISPAALGYIFEAFRQADGSTTRRFGGTGLGLTIAKKLIELQGGEVMVESTVGQGSTFSLTLATAALGS